MAWLMFKDSGGYQYRGKKCDGFPNKANKPHINLSWGMDNLDYLQSHLENPKQITSTKNPNNYSTIPTNQSINEKNNATGNGSNNLDKSKLLPSGLYEKKSQQEQLEKIMKFYDDRRIGKKNQTKVMEINQYGYSSQRAVDRNIQRSETEESAEKIRYLENSLLPVNSPPAPIHRRDTMGSLITQDRLADHDLNQSRISRRSTSGNKKNESRVVFGDGIYNSFIERPQKKKNFHDQLMEMYDYQQKRKDRKVSQIAI